MKATISGGLVLSRTPLYVEPDQTLRLNLRSDLHIGANSADYLKMAQDLLVSGRYLFLGDLMDGILPSDKKRFTPADLHPQLRGRKDIVNVTVKWATEILWPVAETTDLITVGNHETAVEKVHSVDPIAMLIEGLSKHAPKNHQINYGGYIGLHTYEFKMSGHRRPQTFTICYHHGSGSASTIPRVAAHLLALSQWIRADLYWIGHHHQRLVFPAEDLSLTHKGARPVRVRPTWYVATGGYLQSYKPQSSRSVKANGRQSNYVADSGFRPMGLGGATVVLTFGDTPKDLEVQVTL